MSELPVAPAPFIVSLPDAGATDRLGALLAACLGPGDTLLLFGPTGSGKSHLARALIQSAAMSAGQPAPVVPSPTYTLVQPYAMPWGEVIHADLYRLGDTSELAELGLDEAFERALCIVEWPDRLGEAAPSDALRLSLSLCGDGRRAELSASGEASTRLLEQLSPRLAGR